MKYRCAKGHEIDAGPNAFTAFVFQNTKADGSVVTAEYNYCPQCHAEWAVKMWPLREVMPPAIEEDAAWWKAWWRG